MVRVVVVILAAALVAGGIVFAVRLGAPDRFEARASLVLSKNPPRDRLSDEILLPPELAPRTYEAALEGSAPWRSVPELEALLAEGGSVDLEVSEANESALLIAVARSGDAQSARLVADAAATATIAWDVERARTRIRSAIAGLERQVDALTEARDAATPAASNRLELELAAQRARIAELRTLEVLAATPLERAEGATTPAVRVAPMPLRDAAVAALLAAMAALGVVLLRATLRRE